MVLKLLSVSVCCELVRNGPYVDIVSSSYLFGVVDSVVNIEQGPRSGIFSVYILRNVEYILLTYSCPWFCVQIFNCVLIMLWFQIFFLSKLC